MSAWHWAGAHPTDVEITIRYSDERPRMVTLARPDSGEIPLQDSHAHWWHPAKYR
jgi:hypothetical protein